MYLFDKKDDTIEIYSMLPDQRAIAKYREREMAQIPQAHKVLQIKTNAKEPALPKKFELFQNTPPIDIAQNDIHYSHKKFGTEEYHRLQVIDSTPANLRHIYDQLDYYYMGSYNKSQMVRVFNFDESNKRLQFIRYLLLNNSYVKESEKSKNMTIENIINIPESLYLLELLNRGQFTLLDNKNITKQLELFTFSDNPVKTYTLRELEDLSKYGIDKHALNNALNNVTNSEGILSLIRKK